MGACNFRTQITGKFKNAAEAYKAACQQAMHEEGHNSYNGTISTTCGVVDLTDVAPKGEKDFFQWEALVITSNLYGVDKYGKAAAVEIKGVKAKRAKEAAGLKDKHGIKTFYFFGIASE